MPGSHRNGEPGCGQADKYPQERTHQWHKGTIQQHPCLSVCPAPVKALLLEFTARLEDILAAFGRTVAIRGCFGKFLASARLGLLRILIFIAADFLAYIFDFVFAVGISGSAPDKKEAQNDKAEYRIHLVSSGSLGLTGALR
jgi:hypothetical protein